MDSHTPSSHTSRIGSDDRRSDDVSQRITSVLIDHVQSIAEACRATAVFVYTDALGGQPLNLPAEMEEKVIYISRTVDEQRKSQKRGARFLRVPDVNLTRMGQVRIAMFLGLSHGILRQHDVIVCLVGVPASGTLDTLMITEVGQEAGVMAAAPSTDRYLPPDVAPEVVERMIDIAVELGAEGREGKPVGALFVIGDSERVLSLSRQLIINPFRGYTESERNVLDPHLEETIKELSSIDGAFIIRGDGVIETCGAYLKTSLQSEDNYALPRGLGARHHAAAGVTAVTDALAIAVSESTGSVTIFRGGRIVTEIEKPRRQLRPGKEPRPTGS